MSGDKPPGGGGPKKPLPSSTMVGLVPPEKQPAAPGAPPPAAPPAAAGPKRTVNLPPPTRGPHAPLVPPSGQPSASPHAPSGQAPSASPHAPSGQAPSAPHAAPLVEQPSGPTQPFGAATGPHGAPHSPHSPPHAAPHSPPAYGAAAPHSPPAYGAAAPPAAMAPPAFDNPQSFEHQPSGSFGAAPSQPSFGESQPSFGASSFGAPPSQSYGGSGGGGSGGGDLPPGSSFDSIEAPGSKFVAFLKISARRAFRLRIEPSEVLPSERRTLEMSTPPIVDRNLQAFLAWRRSVLFLVASALIPLTIIGVIDALQSRKFTPIFFVRGAPALAEGIFAWVCWSQLKRWSSWRQQRRKLFYGWLIFMIMPFVVFIYPLRTIFEDLGGTSREKLLALGVEGAYRQAVMPFVFAMLAMLQLAPKAISLMPGLIRASLVIKLLFPGSSAPGWLMVIAAPLYALLAYVILIIPYQFTGSGWFIAGVLGVIVAQSFLARAGFALARPMDEDEALRNIERVRKYYMGVMVVSAILIVVALSTLVAKLNLRATDVITAVLKFETNVLILTMIGADLVVTNLDRARGYTAGRGHVEEQSEVKIAAFVSLDAPSSPPPPGPAQ